MTSLEGIKVETVKSMLDRADESNDQSHWTEMEHYRIKREFIKNPVVQAWMRDIQLQTKETHLESWSCYVDYAWDREVKKEGPSGKLYVTFYSEDNEESERLRGLIQQVVHRPAVREISSYHGTINYVFHLTIKDQGTIKITLNHGSLAPSCKVVEEVVTRTEYKIMCDDGSKGSEFLGAGA